MQWVYFSLCSVDGIILLNDCDVWLNNWLIGYILTIQCNEYGKQFNWQCIHFKITNKFDCIYPLKYFFWNYLFRGWIIIGAHSIMLSTQVDSASHPLEWSLSRLLLHPREDSSRTHHGTRKALLFGLKLLKKNLLIAWKELYLANQPFYIYLSKKLLK